MTAPVYGLKVTIDATGSAQGRDVHVKSIQDIRTSSTQLNSTLRTQSAAVRDLQTAHQQLAAAQQTFAERAQRADRQMQRLSETQRQAVAVAQSATRSLEQTYQRAQADIKEASARGLLSPAEARQRGQQAGQAYNQGLLQVIQREGAAGNLSGARGQQLYVNLASQLRDVDQAATSAGRGGLRTISSQLAVMGAQAVGVRAGLGGMVSTIGALSLGALTSLGVIAGLAALALLISKLTEGSRKAKEEIKKLRDEAAELGKARIREADPLGTAARDQRRLLEERIKLEKQLTEAQRGRTLETAEGPITLAPDLERAKKLTEDILKLDQDIAEIGIAGANAYLAIQDRIRADRERAEEKARQAAAQRVQELRTIADLERTNALEVAKLRGNPAAQELAYRDIAQARIQSAIDGTKQLTAAERDRYREALTQEAALEALARATARARSLGAAPPVNLTPVERLKLTTGGQTVVGQPEGLFSRGDAIAVLNERNEQLERARQREIRQVADTRREVIRFAEAMGGLPPSLANAADAVITLVEKIQLGAAKTQDYLLAAGQTIGGFITGQSKGASIARGAIGGATAGAVAGSVVPGIGTVVGGVVGGVLGGIGGLFGSNKQRKEDIAALQEALRGFQFQGAQAARSPVAQELAVLQQQFQELRAEAIRLKQPLGELNRSYAQQRALIQARFQEEQRRFAEDLGVQRLELEGRKEEAAVRRLALEQQRALQEATKAGYDAATLAQLTYVQGLQREALAKEQATAAARRQSSFAEETEQIRLEASGATDALDAYRRKLEEEQALRQAVTDGIDAQNIALREQAYALREAAEAERRRRDELRVGQDLDVEFLQAIGQDRAAQELEFRIRQERRLEEFQKAGYSEDLLEQLRKVQAAQRTQFEAQFTDAGAGAGLGGGVSAGVKDITGITETTGVRLDSRLATVAIILRQIEQNTRGPKSAAPVVVYAPQGTTPADIVQQAVRATDESGARTLSRQNSAQGVAPTV